MKDQTYTKAKILGKHFCNVHGINPENSIKIYKVKPENLLSYKRIDLIPKINYVEDFLKNNFRENTISDYKKIIACFTNNQFIEPGSNKNTFKKYILFFNKIIESIKAKGFDNSISVIPLNSENIILDGSHRVSACIALKKDIYVTKIDKPEIIADAESFLYRGFKLNRIKSFIIDYLAKKNNHQTIILWPFLSRRDKNQAIKIIKRIHPDIIFSDKEKLTAIGVLNLTIISYFEERWLQNNYAYYKNATPKASDISKQFIKNEIVFIILSNCNKRKIQKLKKEIREQLNCSFNGCHSTESSKESFDIASLLLSQNSLHMINKGYPFRYKKFIDKLNIFRSEYVKLIEPYLIVSSSILGLYGVREPNDIDYISLKQIRNQKNHFIESHNHLLKSYKINAYDLLKENQNCLFFLGMKFISLDNFIRMNKYRNENTKKLDVKVAKKLLLNKEYLSFRLYKVFSFLYRKVRIIEQKTIWPLKYLFKIVLKKLNLL